MKIRLELTPEQLKTVEIALNELFNSDRWISGRKEADIDKIAVGAGYLLHVIESYNKNNTKLKTKHMKTAMQELINKIQYSIDKQSGLSITKEQENTLEAIKLVAESLLDKEKQQLQKAFSDGQETPINHPTLPHYSRDEYYIDNYNQKELIIVDFDKVYRSGAGVEKCIAEMLHILIGICKWDAEALYNEVKDIAGTDYTDYDSKGRGLKYRVIHSWFEPYIGE